jgi:hypothetical protein
VAGNPRDDPVHAEEDQRNPEEDHHQEESIHGLEQHETRRG